MMIAQLSVLLSSPQVAAFATTLVLGILYALIGKAGTALEALGAKRKILAFVVIGKRLEAVAYDGPKLKGVPGADEQAVAAAQNVTGVK